MTSASRSSRRSPVGGPDSGFTLVELLVVVMVIAVLAAIATPVYVGVQTSAKDASTKSDLVNARIALQAYVTANKGGWPTLSATDGAANATALKGYGWASSAVLDASTTAGGSASAYCVTETSGSGTSFYLTQSDAATSTKPSGCG